MPLKELLKLANESDDVLRTFGELDTLLYYRIVAEKLKGYLKGREIATKILIPNGPVLLKRGTKLEPLFIDEFIENVDEGFIKLRHKIPHLEQAKPQLNPAQIKIWEYFFPRKLINLFYATNTEHGNNIDRIYYDLDCGEGIDAEYARRAAQILVGLIQTDKDFGKIIKFKIQPLFTGKSFHIVLFFSKTVHHSFYDKYIQFSKDAPDTQLNSFTAKWVTEIQKELPKVEGGHEKEKNRLNIDPSQSPPGKLARAPFSLHMKDAKIVDGVAIPITTEMLNDKNIVGNLQSYTPKKVIEEIDELGKRIVV